MCRGFTPSPRFGQAQPADDREEPDALRGQVDVALVEQLGKLTGQGDTYDQWRGAIVKALQRIGANASRPNDNFRENIFATLYFHAA